MKFPGAIMVLTGCFGLSYRYHCRLNRKIRRIEELIQTLETVEGEVAYGRTTLPECMVWAGKQIGGEMGEALVGLGESSFLHPDESFETILRERMDPLLGDLLEKREQAAFYRIVSPQGYMEEEMFTTTLRRSIRELEESLEQLKWKHREKCKVAYSLGGLGGMLLVLLLL